MKFSSLTFGLAVLLLAGLIVDLARGASRDETKSKSNDSVFEFNKKEPIYITSDWMEVDQKKNTITYKGRVVTIQSEMTMRSETLTAVYDPEMKQIREIIAEGKVNAVQGNRMATGDKAVFDDKAKTVTLTGNPVMRQGNSQVTGSRIIYYIDQDRAVAEGKDSVRVQVTIFPEELQKERNGKSEAGSSTAK
ncbi:MAG TPA: lipopolysaccharide transport periplasmic protein LptA [Candidatus Binatia bacterium]